MHLGFFRGLPPNPFFPSSFDFSKSELGQSEGIGLEG